MPQRIAVIGAGAMARALLEGWTAAGVVDPTRVTVTNRSSDARLEACRRRFGVRVTRDPEALLRGADLVLLATKPGDAPGALEDWRLAGPEAEPRLGLSVCAGLGLDVLAGLAPRLRWVRAMPNIACRTGASATALAVGPGVSAAEAARVRALFAAVGAVHALPEPAFDAATAVGGSGPAFLYRVVELLAAAGAAEGLPPDVARALAIQAMVGAGRTLEATGLPPEVLRAEVTSRGGTTAAGLAVLDGSLDALIREAVRAASRRSREIARALTPARPAAGSPHPPGAPATAPRGAPSAR